MTKKSKNVCVCIKVSLLHATQNVQRALAENDLQANLGSIMNVLKISAR